MLWVLFSPGSGAPAGSGRAPAGVSAPIPPPPPNLILAQEGGTVITLEPLPQAQRADVGSPVPQGRPHWVGCRRLGGSSEGDRPLPMPGSCPCLLPDGSHGPGVDRVFDRLSVPLNTQKLLQQGGWAGSGVPCCPRRGPSREQKPPGRQEVTLQRARCQEGEAGVRRT